jgi:hypothetical protein
MHVLSERPLSAILESTADPFNIKKSNNGRLVSKFLLSLFPIGTNVSQYS